MQFTTVLITAFAILGASAAPAPWQQGGSGGGSSSSKCSTDQTTLCCNNGVGLLSLNCVLGSVVSGGCQDQNVCCDTSGNDNQVTCYNQDGTNINIPINIVLK